jgi:endonuclease/exonuclease/phosphatase family metal-dependent hydrolase
MIQVFHQCFSLIIINVYIPSYNRFGKTKRNTLRKWILNIIARNSHERFIICGDFNSSNSLLPELYNHNLKNEPTFERTSSTKSTLDYIYTTFKPSAMCQFKTIRLEGVSDHMVL